MVVKAPCQRSMWVGLGFSCQDLLTRVEDADNSGLDSKIQEGFIVRSSSLMICQLAQSSSDIVESMSAHFTPYT